MSAPLPSTVIRSNAFPNGLATADDVERLAYLLNPVLLRAQQLSQNGVNAKDNLDGQVIEFQLKTPTDPFTAAALSNSWGQSAGAAPVGYRKDAAGIVWLRGAVDGTLGAGPGDACFTLPAGYRPAYNLRFPSATEVPTLVASTVEVLTTGEVIPATAVVARQGLDGVAFLATQGGAGNLSCFPAQVRISDGKRPTGVLLLACDDAQPGNPSATPNSGATTPSTCSAGLSWSYVGTGTGKPNLLSIDNIPGLALGRTYSVRVLVLF
jgi:hypothetical protein